MPLASGLYYFAHQSGGYEKPPVILLHGAGADCFLWPPEIRRLPELRVFALDLPGHGKSTGPGRQSIEEYARCVISFLDTISLWKAVFVGHSMGGAIALSLALEFPERTAGLGLIATSARFSLPPSLLEDASTPATFSSAVEQLHTLSCGPHTPADVAKQTLKRLQAIRQTLLYADLQACSRFDVLSRLDSIQVPSLVICGTEDKLTPLRQASFLAQGIPNAALQTIDGAGHLVILEQPQRVARLLSIFLKTIPYQPGK